MAYVFKYRLSKAPEPRNDGSGCIDHDIWAIVSVDGGAFVPVPSRHKTISVPAAELEAALGAGNNSQVVTAYKSALAANLATQPVAVVGWGLGDLTAMLDANAAALAQADSADEFILSVASYPVDFAY